jgi:large subunit ribosomal protein L40e
MQIFVKSLTGNTVVYDVSDNDTVDSLKDRIGNKEGIPVERMRLTSAGKQLELGRCLKDCGVIQESTIQVVLYILGGADDTTSLFIPSVYANITDKDIAKTFHRMKIGKVSYIDLVAHRGNDKTGKHNRAFVYFSELYDTAESRNLMREIQTQDSTRLHYAKSPHVFWVLVKNKGRTSKDEFQRNRSPSFEEMLVEPADDTPMTMSELELSNAGNDVDPNAMDMDDVSITDSFANIIDEFEAEMDCGEEGDYSLVSAEYAQRLEWELSHLRYQYNILLANCMYFGNGPTAVHPPVAMASAY